MLQYSNNLLLWYLQKVIRHNTTKASRIMLDYSSYYRLIGQVSSVLAIGPGDLGSISGRFILKILKMVLDTSLLNAEQYKVCIKGKVEQSREKSSTLTYI